MYRMRKDVIGSVSSIGKKDPFTGILGIFIKESYKCFFFIQLMNALKNDV